MKLTKIPLIVGEIRKFVRSRANNCFSALVIVFALSLTFVTEQAWGAANNVYVTVGYANATTKICYKVNAWPNATCGDGVDDKTLEDASLAAGDGGTLILDGGASGIVYSDSQIGGSVLANTFYLKANNTIRKSTDSGRSGTVTIRSTTANRTLRPAGYNLELIGINLDNTNAAATTGALEINQAVTSLIITNSNLTSTGAGGGGHGLYIANTVGTLTISGSTFNNCAGKGIFVNHATGVTGSGTVTNSSFNYNSSNGAYGNLNKIAWSGCEFAYNKGHGLWADASIGAMTSGSFTGCTSHDNKDSQSSPTTWYHGFCLDGSTNGCTGITISRCYAYNVDAAFVVQDGANSNIIQYSIGDGGDCSSAGTCHGLFTSNTNANNVFYNLTLVARVATVSVIQIDAGDSGVMLKNIIAKHTNGGNVFYIEAGYAAYPTMDNNIYYSSKSNPFLDNATSRTFAEWKAASTQDSNSKNSDPLLTSDYKLGGGSPAIDGGTPIFTAVQWASGGDYAGLHYVYGRGPDMGAYEKKRSREIDDEMLPWKCKSANTACYAP